MSNALMLRYKTELKTTSELIELMEVLKQVAASQFRSLDETRREARWTAIQPPEGGQTKPGESPATPYRRTRRESFSSVGMLEPFFRLIPPAKCVHPLLEESRGRLGLLIVTSDEGFLGGLNAWVLQHALSLPGAEDSVITVLGAKGKLSLSSASRPCAAFPGVGRKLDRGRIEQIRDHLLDLYQRGRVARVLACFPEFHSISQQEITSVQVLPYLRPKTREGVAASRFVDTIIEPSAKAIIEYLVKLWLGRKLHEIFWQSRLSELAARLAHLETTVQNLKDGKKKLFRCYFRSKHEAVDASIRESFAGMIAREKPDDE